MWRVPSWPLGGEPTGSRAPGRGNAKLLNSLLEIHSWGKTPAKISLGSKEDDSGSVSKPKAEAGICLPAACMEKAWSKGGGLVSKPFLVFLGGVNTLTVLLQRRVQILSRRGKEERVCWRSWCGQAVVCNLGWRWAARCSSKVDENHDVMLL